MAGIDSRVLSTTVASPCQTLRRGFALLSLPSARMRSEGTVVGCLSVCLSVTLHLTSRMSVRLTNDATGNEGQKL